MECTLTIEVNREWFYTLFTGERDGDVADVAVGCMAAATDTYRPEGRQGMIARLLAKEPDTLEVWSDIIGKAQKIAADARNKSGMAGKG